MRKNICLLAVIFSSVSAEAQFALGIATSNYNTINSIYLNPANIAACKEKVSVNLFFLDVSADNNLGTISEIGDIFKNNGGSAISASGANKNFSMIVPYGEVRGPSFLISSNGDFKSGFAITTRVRLMNQLNNFNESIYNTLADPNSASGKTITDSSRNFNWTAQLWSEVGISYGLALIHKDNSQLNVGFTVRYLGSQGYIGLKGSNMNVSYKSGSDSFQAINSDLEYASNILTPSGAISNGVNASKLFNGFLGTSAANGLSTDFGVTYTCHLNNSKNEFGDAYGDDPRAHSFKLSAAVTDIGSIKYKDGFNSVVNVTGNGYLTGTGIAENSNNYTQFKNYALTRGFTVDTSQHATKVHLPTALILGADCNVTGRFYATAAFIGNLVNRTIFGNSYYSQFSIIPRYDTKLISVGMPLTYSSLAHEYKVGLGFRFSGFYFGSDDMLALVSNRQHGFGAYIGASVPIYKKKA